MTHFEEYGYQIVRNAFSQETSKLLETEFTMLKDAREFLKGEQIHDDGFVEKAYFHYGAFCFESLLLYLLPTVEEVIGKKLYPSYSYGRIYYEKVILSLQENTVIVIHSELPAGTYMVVGSERNELYRRKLIVIE